MPCESISWHMGTHDDVRGPGQTARGVVEIRFAVATGALATVAAAVIAGLLGSAYLLATLVTGQPFDTLACVGLTLVGTVTVLLALCGSVLSAAVSARRTAGS
jgi:hypothetical protein